MQKEKGRTDRSQSQEIEETAKASKTNTKQRKLQLKVIIKAEGQIPDGRMDNTYGQKDPKKNERILRNQSPSPKDDNEEDGEEVQAEQDEDKDQGLNRKEDEKQRYSKKEKPHKHMSEAELGELYAVVKAGLQSNDSIRVTSLAQKYGVDRKTLKSKIDKYLDGKHKATTHELLNQILIAIQYQRQEFEWLRRYVQPQPQITPPQTRLKKLATQQQYQQDPQDQRQDWHPEYTPSNTLPGLVKSVQFQQHQPQVENQIHTHDWVHFELNEELFDKTFLDGNGFVVGPRDLEIFANIKNIDPAFENLVRWHKYMSFHQIHKSPNFNQSNNYRRY